MILRTSASARSFVSFSIKARRLAIGELTDWWLLDPLDVVEISFEGIALGLLTHCGPDSGYINCEVVIAGNALGQENRETEVRRKRICLFDKWCYYYRLSINMLWSDLPPGKHSAKVGIVTVTQSTTLMKIAKRDNQFAWTRFGWRK